MSRFIYIPEDFDGKRAELLVVTGEEDKKLWDQSENPPFFWFRNNRYNINNGGISTSRMEESTTL